MLDSVPALDLDFLLITPDIERTNLYAPIIPNAELLQLNCEEDASEHVQNIYETLHSKKIDTIAVVHRPPLDANTFAQKLRALPGGKDFYIVVIVPYDVKPPSGVTTDVDDFLILSAQHLDKSVLQRCLSRYNRNVEIRNEFVAATRTAVSAIESASEYGSLIHYFEANENCNSFGDLKETIADFLLSRNLSVDFVIDTGESLDYWISENRSRNHRFMLDRMRKAKKRMVSTDKLLGFYFEHFTLLISNAPYHEAEKYGRLKDTLAHFCTITEARIRGLIIKESISKQNNDIVTVMNLIRASTEDAKKHVESIMKTLVSDIELAANTFDMNLQEEEKLLQVAQHAASSLWQFHDNSQQLEIHFLSLVESISAMKKLTCASQDAPIQMDSVELF